MRPENIAPCMTVHAQTPGKGQKKSGPKTAAGRGGVGGSARGEQPRQSSIRIPRAGRESNRHGSFKHIF